jgi:tetraacyldisaccharide 4'-kinase
MTLEEYVLEIMEGKRRGRSVLTALSLLFRTGVSLRQWGYDRQILKTYRPPVPVISIGNIVAGGTGKTPLVHRLALELSEGLRVAVLSRGYRSAVEKSGAVHRVTQRDTAAICGDEPYLLMTKLPKVAIWVARERVKAAEAAVQEGAEILILDDGMQHRQLCRDVEIVVMDGQDLFGRDHFLPRGLLRDSPRRLKEADLIVVNRARDREAVRAVLRPFTSAPIVFMEMVIDSDLRGQKVGVFCAVGRPDRFLQTVRAIGGEVVAAYFKPDHHPFSAEELLRFAKRSRAELLVCTEKDRVKLPDDLACPLPIRSLTGHLEIVEGEEYWENMKAPYLERV